MDEKGNVKVTTEEKVALVMQCLEKNKFASMYQVSRETGLSRHNLYSLEAKGLIPKLHRASQSEAATLARKNNPWGNFTLPGSPVR